MKNFLLVLSFGLFCQVASAQLYAENNSYLFSKGTNIFVKKKVRLRGGSVMYMRNEAQLLQEENVPNEGSGFISVYQEGTSNEYTYNYWSSPVSTESTGSDGNVGFRRTIFHYPITGGSEEEFARAAGDAVFLNPPNYEGTSDDGTGSRPLEIAGYWLWNFDSSGNTDTGYAGWIPFQDDTTTLDVGLGFTMKGVQSPASSPNFRTFNGATNPGQRYDIRGRANNGDISVGVADDNGTLAGNPYPSALDLKRFLQVNSEHVSGNDVKIDPAVSFWESQQESSHFLIDYLGGYGQYVPLGFDSGSDNGFANSGSYSEPCFRRTDNNGNIRTSTLQTGGGTEPGGRRYAPIGQGFFIFRTNTAIPETEQS